MLVELILIIVIIFSIILHEVAHGFSALLLGDQTAKHQGRLTLNPVPHIDLLGTIILPVLLIISSFGVIFGWAKPVPYNPYNLRGRYAEAIVAAAGPLTNVGIALIAAVIHRLSILPEALMAILPLIIFINLFLAFINLLPIPPLDGGKIVSALLPVNLRLKLEGMVPSILQSNNIAIIILVLLFIVFFLIDPLVQATTAITSIFIGI